MASSAENPSIIEEYSQTFTSLKLGTRELIQYGADAVALNRFIVDAAGATSEPDYDDILQAIDLTKVTQGDTESACAAYCESALKRLISLQEEVSVLQKTAREKGISGGLLTIIGQAASQSPDDNGASVLQQLSKLVQGNESEQESEELAQPMTQATDGIALDESAANDIDRFDHERMTGLQLAGRTLLDHWKPLAIDASVCAIAAAIAISLIN